MKQRMQVTRISMGERASTTSLRTPTRRVASQGGPPFPVVIPTSSLCPLARALRVKKKDETKLVGLISITCLSESTIAP